MPACCRTRSNALIAIALSMFCPFLLASAVPETPSGGICTPGNPILDGGFEAAVAEPGDPLNSPSWVETSTMFGTPLCTIPLCGSGGGTAGPRTGNTWSRFGGAGGAVAETATISQSVVFPSGAVINLNFHLWIGAVEAPFTDVLTVKVDGVIRMILDEPGGAEVGYTMRSHNLNGFADGAAHTILFEYVKVPGGN